MLFLAYSCSDDDNGTTPIVNPITTVVDLALDTEDLSILVTALTRANLVTTLQGDGPFRVLHQQMQLLKPFW